MPLDRITCESAPPSIVFHNRSGWKGLRERYTKLLMPYSSVSGVCLFISSLIQPGDCDDFSISNNPVLRMSFGSTLENVDLSNCTSGFNLRIMDSNCCAASGVTKSSLFRIMTLANSICEMLLKLVQLT